MFETIFVQPLFNILFAIYGYLPGHDFGIAVILMTVLTRLAIWPLVTRQLHSQKKVQALAPEVARVRAEAKGDRERETKMLMELYKEKGTSPFAPLLPILVQLPIFFALYLVFIDSLKLDKIRDLSYDFVMRIPVVSDIIAGKVQFSPQLFDLVDLTKPNIFLALAAGAAQFYQSKMLQSKNQPMDDQAKLPASIIYIFPVITIVIAMTLPSALALYWAVTSIVACIQQYIVLLRDADELKEEAVVVRRKTVGKPGGAK